MPVALGYFSAFAEFKECCDIGFSPWLWEEVEAHADGKESC